MDTKIMFARLSMLLAFRERVDEVMKDESISLKALSRWIDLIVEVELGKIGKSALMCMDIYAPNSSLKSLEDEKDQD